MKWYKTTHSLTVLAGMLEAGKIDGVRFCIHGVNEGDKGSCVLHSFTPEQLREMDRGTHKMACVKWTQFHSTGHLYAVIGRGLKHVV